MHDAIAERGLQHLPEPTRPWRAPGVHVEAGGSSRGGRVGRAVSHSILASSNFKFRREMLTRQQQLTQPLLPTDAPPLPKRADSQLTPPDGWGRCACLAGPLGSVGIRTSAEGRHVAWLALQAFFANGVFVFGRNVGPALFMREVSAEGLTSVMFVSGLLVLVCTLATPVLPQVSQKSGTSTMA